MLKEDFAAAAMLSSSLADTWYEPVERAMMEFAIVSPARAAAFIAQIGHESAGFVYTSEIWGPTEAQKGYDGRADLGNTRPEAVAIAREHGSTPGRWWAGHGLIQITGYDNHREVGEALGLDLLNRPQDITLPILAARSAGWWWARHGCNELADAGDLTALTKRINGGTNGLADRQRRWDIARAVMGA